MARSLTKKIPHEKGNRILIVQSTESTFILKALQQLKEGSIFCNPCYTLFCRNRPGVVESFQNHPMLDQILVHTEAHHSWSHLRNLRNQGFDAVILFMTGDPGYWKVKLFAFLLGVPLGRILIFNENSDCFFFNWSQWIELVSIRMRERLNSGTGIKHTDLTYIIISPITKMALFPFRFLWLLLVWTRLRLSGIKASRKNYDNSLQLPPFPGA
jgi:hypothetical protein